MISTTLCVFEQQAANNYEDVAYNPNRTITLTPTMGSNMPSSLTNAIQEASNQSNSLRTPHKLKSRRQEIQETIALATPQKRLKEVTKGPGIYNTLTTFLEEGQLWNTELKAAGQESGEQVTTNIAPLIVPNRQVQAEVHEVNQILDNTKLQ